MKNQRLTGYLLHTRPYQEKRAIYQLFSHEFGLVHGVGARGMPTFVLLELFAGGKNELKTFSQIQLSARSVLKPVMGQVQYALLYMNEVLSRLLPLESPCPTLWQVYHEEVIALQALGNLEASGNTRHLKVSLRRFERALFDELGASIDFIYDAVGKKIDAEAYYRFVPEMGFILTTSSIIHQAQSEGKKVSRVSYLGCDLLLMGRADGDEKIYYQKIEEFGQLQRDVMNYLLDYKPLHSRKLWQQSLFYQQSS
ncbi:DNA repair protein RecO [Moraxella sp. ZY200743]|uniref:DNA repair protein RecO n=1 Tax=Moraxella sp. ZY200743 TaxID=2911970 RepID=UPI003D7E4373